MASIEASQVQFLLSVIHHTEGRVNWEGVALDNGINYARNATAKFNTFAKYYGYKFEGGQCIKLEDPITAGSTAVGPKTPKKKAAKGGKDAGPPSSGKKRKLKAVSDAEKDEDDGDDGGDDDDDDDANAMVNEDNDED